MSGQLGDDTAALARRLIDANRYMTLATADADGRPWATPVWFAPMSEGELLWVSRPERRHSQNLAVRPDVAIVIFDSTVPIGGAEALYLEATVEILDGPEIERGIEAFSRRSVAAGGMAWDSTMVQPPAEFRLYRATATAQFVLGKGDNRLPVQPA